MDKKLILFSIFLLSALSVFAVDQLMTFQGDALQNNTELNNSNLTVEIYSAAAGANCVYNHTFNKSINNGRFDVLLGNETPQLTLDWGEMYYVDVSINGEKVTAARQQFMNGIQSVLRMNSTRISIQTNTSEATGVFSVAFGFLNTASANYATVSGGRDNNATSAYDAVCGGYDNEASGGRSFVGGGGFDAAGALTGNIASGSASVVVGGSGNIASGGLSFVGGGGYQALAISGINRALDDWDVVVGGTSNLANGTHAFVGGGFSNIADGVYSFVGGGRQNNALAIGAFVGGGGGTNVGNEAQGQYSAIVGGSNNNASGQYSFIGGGQNNLIKVNSYATIAGGRDNTAGGSTSFIGGGQDNNATNNYAVVVGGLRNNASNVGAAVVGGWNNAASGPLSFVGGGGGPGQGNEAGGDSSFVGGGRGNNATGDYAVVVGGLDNNATGDYSTIPGGRLNNAQTNYSFAGGINADANTSGCFAWGTSGTVRSGCNESQQATFLVKGGMRIITSANFGSGMVMAGGGSAWAAVSDKNKKENFKELDKKSIVEKIANMPITEWNYKAQDDSIRHIGPMAQDFNPAFGFTELELYVNSMDIAGVSLAAIQGLYQITQEQENKINNLEQRLSKLEQSCAR